VHTVVAADHSALPADASLQDVLFDLQLRFKKWLSQHGLQCSCRRFTLAAINRDKKDLICQFSCKAAQAPPIIAWLAELTADFAVKCDASTKDEAELVSVCLWGLSTFFDVVRCSDRFFTDEQVALLDRGGHAHLFAYSALAEMHVPGNVLWHHVPKHHHFQHLLLDAASDRSNPRFFSCFADEDAIGKTLRIARKSHATTVVEHVVTCFALGAKQRLES
jgi:hypothetical protein